MAFYVPFLRLVFAAGIVAASTGPAYAFETADSGEHATNRVEPGFDVVPKSASLHIGWLYSYDNGLPNGYDATATSRPQAGEVMAGYLWQVGGLKDGWPSWIGFYLGWAEFPEQRLSVRTGVLEYGLRVKHALFPGARSRPFLTYGLGTTQVWVDGFDGRDITHQTRVGVGVDISMGESLQFTCEIEWRTQILPTMGGQDWSFSTVAITSGFSYDIGHKPGKRVESSSARRDAAGGAVAR